MESLSENDRQLIGFLQKMGPKSVAELAALMSVTETAVRQRLTRLSAQGLIGREEQRLSRGRPIYKYSLTRSGKKTTGKNFSELITAVWDEVKQIGDSQIREQVISGIAKRLAKVYRDEVEQIEVEDSNFEKSDSESTDNRNADRVEQPAELKAKQIAKFFENRGIPVTLELKESLPVLNLHGCPFPDLSDNDDLICSMEQTMFSELAGCEIEMHRCDKKSKSGCCSFQLDHDLTQNESENLEPNPENSDQKSLQTTSGLQTTSETV